MFLRKFQKNLEIFWKLLLFESLSGSLFSRFLEKNRSKRVPRRVHFSDPSGTSPSVHKFSTSPGIIPSSLDELLMDVYLKYHPDENKQEDLFILFTLLDVVFPVCFNATDITLKKQAV